MSSKQKNERHIVVGDRKTIHKTKRKYLANNCNEYINRNYNALLNLHLNNLNYS